MIVLNLVPTAAKTAGNCEAPDVTVTEQKTFTSRELVEALNIITRIGALALQSGAASFRTQDIMRRVAAALGVQRLDTIVMPTGIVVTVHGQARTWTQTLKVQAPGVNMARVAAFEALSRKINADTPLTELSAMVDAVEHTPSAYSPQAVVAAVGLACGAFAIILGGGPLEFVAAACGAAVAQITRMLMIKHRTNPYLVTASCAAIATAVSYLLAHLTMVPSPRLAMIASVLLLVPGVPLVTSLLDMIHFDLISGVTRGVYAALLLVNIGIGMLFILYLTGMNIL